MHYAPMYISKNSYFLFPVFPQYLSHILYFGHYSIRIDYLHAIFLKFVLQGDKKQALFTVEKLLHI